MIDVVGNAANGWFGYEHQGSPCWGGRYGRSDNVANLASEQRVTEDAVSRLQKAGFEVLQSTPATMNIAHSAMFSRAVPSRRRGTQCSRRHPRSTIDTSTCRGMCPG
jgi:hypothetical protein